MICDICGKEDARIRRVSRSYGKGDNLLVIEHIPVVSCPHCGESYITAETLCESSASSCIDKFRGAEEYCCRGIRVTYMYISG